MPDWLVSHDSQLEWRFPTPISNPNITYDPTTGYPSLDDCLKARLRRYILFLSAHRPHRMELSEGTFI